MTVPELEPVLSGMAMAETGWEREREEMRMRAVDNLRWIIISLR